MRDARLRLFWHRAGPLTAIIAVAVAGEASQGCGGGGGSTGGTGGGAGGTGGSTTTTTTTTTTTKSTTTTTTMTGTGGTGTGGAGTGGTGGMNNCVNATFQSQITPAVNGGFTDAFDATPNAKGTAVFFTAVDSMGNAGVFTQGICPAGAVSAVFTGGAFEAPFGIAISTDDKTLYVADLSAAEDATDMTGTKDKGVIFSLSATGGMAPVLLVGSVAPRGLTVVSQGGADQIYFTGFDKANGLPGVFKMAAAGGAVTVIAEGNAASTPVGPFDDPGGVAVAANGDVYVLDTSASGSHLGSVIKVPMGGAGAQFVPNLQVGFPAGIALLADDSMLLASGLNPSAESDTLTQVTVASKAVTNVTTGVAAFSEAAGMHRAHAVNVFAWADTKATPMGMTGTGTVFVIK